MTYIRRHAETTVEELAKMFGAILVAGPRQVGKTTMLQRMTEGFNYVTLDDIIIRAGAREQSGTFFKDNPPPVFSMRFRKHLSCSRKSKCSLTGIIEKVSSLCAAHSSSK